MDCDTGSDSNPNPNRNPVLEMRMKKECFLKNAQEALSDPFSAACFNFSSTGLVLQAMDTSGGAYAVLHLSSKAFDHYACDYKHLSVDLDLPTVSKVFSFANNNEIITIKYELKDGLTFPIWLGSPGSTVISCFYLDFEFDLTEASVGAPEYPKSSCQAIVCMPSAKFKHLCDKLSCDTGDRKVISILVDKDNVRFFTDKSSAIVRPQTQNGDKPNEATRIVMKEKVSLTFGLRYLKNFSNASTLSDQVTIKLWSHLLLVEYKIAEMGEMGYLRYHVMPAYEEAEAERILKSIVLES